jgi:hypothetical protein
MDVALALGAGFAVVLIALYLAGCTTGKPQPAEGSSDMRYLMGCTKGEVIKALGEPVKQWHYSHEMAGGSESERQRFESRALSERLVYPEWEVAINISGRVVSVVPRSGEGVSWLKGQRLPDVLARVGSPSTILLHVHLPQKDAVERWVQEPLYTTLVYPQEEVEVWGGRVMNTARTGSGPISGKAIPDQPAMPLIDQLGLPREMVIKVEPGKMEEGKMLALLSEPFDKDIRYSSLELKVDSKGIVIDARSLDNAGKP